MGNTETLWLKSLFAPIRDNFYKYGDKFEKVAYNPANGMYCFKRTPKDGRGPVYYEVFKAKKAKDENGNTYDRYPSSAEFGFGVALCIRGDGKDVSDKLAYYMANGFAAGRYGNGDLCV